MPSPLTASGAKRRGLMVRQLSLQGTTPPLAGGGARPGLRRQLSDDVSHKPDVALHIGPGNSAKGPEKGPSVRPAARPKPVRLAWADRRHDSAESIPGEGVEVVARRCAGLPRPTSRGGRAPNLPFLDKESAVLTRQQLAERLRRAWRDRDRKPNLDIFLAHSRPESAVSARSGCDDSEPDAISFKPIRAVHRPNTPVSNVLQERDDSNMAETLKDGPDKALKERNMINIDLGMENTEDSPSHTTELLDFKMFSTSSNIGSEKQFQKRSLSFTKQYSFNKENVDVTAPVSTSSSVLSASERRASFKSSQLLNKTITGSFSDDPDDDPEGGGLKVFLTKAVSSARPPLVRTSSAPPQKTSRPTSPASQRTPIVKPPKPNPPEKKPVFNPVTKMEVGGQDEEDSSQSRDRAARRKLKAAGARRKTKDHEESSDEEERGETGTKKPPRRRQLPRGSFGSDIITMVSLVSPAESDVEEPPLPMPLAPPTDKKPEESTPERASDEPTQEIHPGFILQKCVALRKTAKTVSFQSHPPVSRSCSASFPSRRVPPGAPIIIPTPITATPVLNPAQEIRGSHQQDNRGVKRRLVRSRTTPAKEDEENVSSDDTCRNESSAEPALEPGQPETKTSPPMRDSNEEEDQEPKDEEAEIKSPKERECWMLYKRMQDKGVAVSYETVLRGMLTPTEYRLRRNQLSRC